MPTKLLEGTKKQNQEGENIGGVIREKEMLLGNLGSLPHLGLTTGHISPPADVEAWML